MPFSIVRRDITTMQVDAIVNAANSQLQAGGGVCGAIFATAGLDDLQAACDELAPIATSDAAATPSFALAHAHDGNGPRHIIHAVGPVWHGGSHNEAALLASCYTRSLDLASKLGARSVAFPLISSGIYGYPPAGALAVATEAITGWLVARPDRADAGDEKNDTPELEVYLALLKTDPTLVETSVRRELEWYVNETLFSPPDALEGPSQPHGLPGTAACAPAAGPTAASATGSSAGPTDLAELLDNLDASFGDTLLAMIDERNLTDAQVYHAANMSRQTFAKLRAGGNPSKRTVLALAIAMGLDLHETQLLLQRAGLALTHSSKSDVIVEWFLRRGGANIFDVNNALFQFDLPTLN